MQKTSVTGWSVEGNATRGVKNLRVTKPAFNGVDIAVSSSLIATVKNDGRFCTFPRSPSGDGTDLSCTDGRQNGEESDVDSNVLQSIGATEVRRAHESVSL